MIDPNTCSCRQPSPVSPCNCTCRCELDFQRRVRRRRAAARSRVATTPPVSVPTARPDSSLFFALSKLVASIQASVAGPWVDREPVPQPASDRSAYTETDLRRLFSAPDYLDWVDGHPHRFWGPLLALCMGLRATEISRIHAGDVGLEYGYWCISVASPRQRPQALQADRTMPIPQALIDLGFLDFAASGGPNRSGYLFPALMAQRAGLCSADPSVGGQRLAGQFALYAMLFEFAPRRVFKALRSTLELQLARQGVTEATIAYVLGRADKSVRLANSQPTRASLVIEAARVLDANVWPMQLPHFKTVARRSV